MILISLISLRVAIVVIFPVLHRFVSTFNASAVSFCRRYWLTGHDQHLLKERGYIEPKTSIQSLAAYKKGGGTGMVMVPIIYQPTILET
jgi:hypothetical protein